MNHGKTILFIGPKSLDGKLRDEVGKKIEARLLVMNDENLYDFDKTSSIEVSVLELTSNDKLNFKFIKLLAEHSALSPVLIQTDGAASVSSIAQAMNLLNVVKINTGDLTASIILESLKECLHLKNELSKSKKQVAMLTKNNEQFEFMLRQKLLS